MAQQVKIFAAKPDDVSSSPRPQLVEEESLLPSLSPDLHIECHANHTHVHTPMCTQNY